MNLLKNLVLILSILFCIPGYTGELKLGLNLLSIHGLDRSESYHNSVDKQGIFMYTKFVYLRYNQNYFVVGKDSVGSNMVGYMYEYNNFIFGAYSYNQSDWKKVHQENKLGENLGFIPYFGYKVNLGNSTSLVLNPLLTTLNIEF